MIDPISAPSIKPAWSTVSATAIQAPGSTGGVSSTGGDFASLLGEAISGVAQKLRSAELVSIAGMKGLASTQEVVETVMAAEHSLQAAIAVRDKVINAYLEISRMAI